PAEELLLAIVPALHPPRATGRMAAGAAGTPSRSGRGRLGQLMPERTRSLAQSSRLVVIDGFGVPGPARSDRLELVLVREICFLELAGHKNKVAGLRALDLLGL